MHINELDFKLPRELISHEPPRQRGNDRLLCLNRSDGRFQDCKFESFPNFLPKNSLIVLNDSKVYKAHLLFSDKNNTVGEILLVRKLPNKHTWLCMVDKSQHQLPGSCYELAGSCVAKILESLPNGLKTIHFSVLDHQYLEKYGQISLPPYTKRHVTEQGNERYQTIYAQYLGSCAAPTAGLHFTNPLLESLKSRVHQLAFISLHIGLGTFVPIRSQNIYDHVMHNEYYTITEQTAALINDAYYEKRPVIAIGTTSCRTLESAFNPKSATISVGTSSTSIFIYPGYHFRAIQGLLTNFHTPKSTLLALVYAFAGYQAIKKCLYTCNRQKISFFSYSYAMLYLIKKRNFYYAAYPYVFE